MIEDEQKEIEKLKRDYVAVEQGLLYNPLCKDTNMKEILKIIAEKKDLVSEWQEALQEIN